MRNEDERRTAHAIHQMMSAERTLSFTWKTKGQARAYEKVSANDLRFFRNGAPPSLGIESAVAASATRPRDISFEPRGEGMSRSWDLGYSYGLATTRTRGGAPDTSSYVHVWRRNDRGDWKLLLDIENEVPKRP